MLALRLNPITRKRLRRFVAMKRASLAFALLVILYAVSLAAELLCNSRPLYVSYEGRAYFPVFRFYPDDEFTGSGQFTRPDYKAISRSAAFRRDPGNRMVFPPVPYGPYEVIDAASVALPDHVTVTLRPEPKVGSVSVARDLTVLSSVAAGPFFGVAEGEVRGRLLTERWRLNDALRRGLLDRFRNLASARVAVVCTDADGTRVELSVPAFEPRPVAPRTVRVTLRGVTDRLGSMRKLVFDRRGRLVRDQAGTWSVLAEADRARVLAGVRQRFGDAEVTPMSLQFQQADYRVSFDREQVRFPFRPVRGHWLGIDNAGRDVLARVLYGLRTSMTFGLVLVVCSLCVGTLVGAGQGYFGGAVDITGQRLVEIWSALPFLYIMILMGSVYGRSFALLIVCYGLFNWIGISYYMRAEMLRLRKQPFVEAARCLGLPARKIVFRHILPNGLVPLITFFPFSLVGAIGSLAALDYLGFGLPPPTPSWGELLQQAQQYRWAWWLILYPSLALFTVMLLGVFVGEGVRNAFDPRRYSRLR